MKRYFILFVVVALFLVGATLSAEEAVLIDFSVLAADILPNQSNVPTQNRATMMDFSSVAGSSFTKEQKALMKTSLALSNWEVVLASSSRSVLNQAKSMTAEAAVKATAKNYAGKKVLGVRVHFPVESYNSWALIKPPFEIPAFESKTQIADDGTIQAPTAAEQAAKYTRFEGDIDKTTGLLTGFGVVKNVGVVKSVAVDVMGLNFQHGLSVVIKDENADERSVFMGYLNFDGWRELRWDNPNYVTEVRNRELRIYPMYPKSTPFFKFNGFIIQRDSATEGGDFVAYIKDVKILYDKAVLDTDRDIDDENLWNIIKDRETSRKSNEIKRFGNQQVMRYLEDLKQNKKDVFTDTTGATQ